MANGVPGAGIYDALSALVAQRKAEALQQQQLRALAQQQAFENQLKQRAAAIQEQQANRPIVTPGGSSLLSPQGGLLGTAPAAVKPPTFSSSPLGIFNQQTGEIATPAPQKPTEQPVMRVSPRTGKMEQLGTAPTGAHFVNEPAPQQPSLVQIQTVDEQGNPVTRIVDKRAGQEFKKQPNAVTANRADSAKAVLQTGNDIIAKMSDPQYSATVGPVLGRYNTLREFIGNPPPEFADLAGNIESYALANMGVHGMRSNQGALAIKELLDKRQTPQSLAAAIRGLNNFSAHFMENLGREAPKPEAAPATTTPAPKTLSPALQQLLGR